MKKTNHILKLSLFTALLASLTACGGGGDDSSSNATPTSTPTSAPVSAGKVDAPFVAGSSARYALMSSAGQAFGALPATAQPDANGAYNAIGSYSTTNAQIIDLAGNADYAMGTWLGGSYTASGSATTNTSGVYYAVYNPVSTLSTAADASLTCGAHLSSTRSSATLTGSITGSATASITGGVAQTAVTLSLVAADGTTIPLAATASFSDTKLGFNIGSLLSGGSGIGIGLGQAANNGYVIIAPWTAVTASKQTYQGIATFTCK